MLTKVLKYSISFSPPNTARGISLCHPHLQMENVRDREIKKFTLPLSYSVVNPGFKRKTPKPILLTTPLTLDLKCKLLGWRIFPQKLFIALGVPTKAERTHIKV